MKNSGIEWIGDIPQDWDVRKLKNIVELKNEKSSSESAEVYIGLENVESWTGKYLVTDSEFQNEGTATHFDASDILFGKLRPYLAKCWIATFNGKCSSEFLVLRSSEIISSFLFHSLLSHWFINIVDASTYGAKMPRASWSFIGETLIPIPLLIEQQTIADYLNRMCSQIDSTIEKQKTVIEKLKLYKQSIITEVVTKGLDPTVEMKSSGIEWIGKIPKKWEIIRLRYLCKILTGNKDTINKNDVGQYSFYVRSPKIERIDTFSFNGEAVLMAGDGIGAGKIFHYVNEKFDYHQRVYNIHNFKRLSAKYLYYYLQENFKKEIEQSNAKSTVDSIRLPMLLNFPILVSDISEQKAIADFLDRKCLQIYNVINCKQKLIERLSDYKKSLIYECVTGKREVE